MKACQRHDPFLQPRSAESPSTLWLAAGRNKNQDLFHSVQRKNIWWLRLEFLKETQEYIVCFRRNIRNYSILPNAVSHHNAVLRVDACLMIWWWAISPVSKQYITYPETLMSKVEMQNAKIQLTLRTTICTRCLSKLKARCPEKVWSDQTKNGLKFPLNSWMPTSGTCLVVSPGLNQFEPGRNDLQCVWLANAIQIEVVKIYQPSEDWQQQSQAVPHLASWCSSDTLLHSNFYWKFVKLAVGSSPVCVFDKSIGLLVNIPFCSWRKQPNPWRHPGTPLPEITRWFSPGTPRIHTKDAWKSKPFTISKCHGMIWHDSNSHQADKQIFGFPNNSACVWATVEIYCLRQVRHQVSEPPIVLQALFTSV